VVLQPQPAPGEQGTVTQDTLNQAVDIIRARVNGTGVAEADVTTQGSGANAVIVVSVPGVNEQQLVDQVSKSARMTFRPVLAATNGAPTPTPTPTPTATKKSGATPKPSATKKSGQGSGAKASPTSSSQGSVLPRTNSASPSPTASLGSGSGTPSPATTGSPSPTPVPTTTTPSSQTIKTFQTADCTDPKTRQQIAQSQPENAPAVACSTDGQVKYLLGPVAVDGKDIVSASASIPTNSTAWTVNVNFNATGSKAFGDITGQLAKNQSPKNQFAIVLDGLVVSAPVPEGPIYGGAQITGQFTQAEATLLANQLKYGSLPLEFKVAETQTISPTLGSDQLRAGLIAGALGLLVVVIYLLLYYRALGLVAVASLLIAAGLTYGLVVLLSATMGYTLTLAGVAGLVVAIGITADSFIVYFERIRDEMRDGRTLRVALENGWVRARRTIIAADSVSLMAAVILYALSVGGVRGFAFSLGLTTLVDLLVVFTFTKPIMTIIGRWRFFNSGSRWSGVSAARLGEPTAVPTPSRRGAATPVAATSTPAKES
jgi:preprotein translocase subunit SecD